MREFASGMLVAGYLVAGLHFLKFRRRTGDRLFLMFAIAFWTLALQRTGVAVIGEDSRSALLLYTLRILAFLLIIYAIVDKNRAPRTRE